MIKSFEIDGLKLNVKSFKVPNAFNSLVYKCIRPSKAKRSFQYASRLIDCGISTPFPIAYIENTTAFGLKTSYYISQHIDYDFEFRELIHKPQFPERNIILKQFAAFTFKLHENNINFLDHSPGNTLITKDDSDYKFYLIDLNRMRFETMTFDKRMHNFRRLWLSKTMIKVIAEAYAKLYNKSYKETHDLMLKHSRAFQLKINSKKLRRSGRKMRFSK
ncbi:lipopolysaccharide kinase InaA family protein [Olleya sp. YS]|uniref:lipopolysaccharide kinase InaA family protein n=1 Tax=Olleya sp. YS TaxID=3028318 RepID=UPI002434567E|nr:lipopolysaccharide kinase InaA family protein [Olleya sp. YS]WGD33974.1 lipopolysaccharide kinase InaA family protein [Olleya sp. YS]